MSCAENYVSVVMQEQIAGFCFVESVNVMRGFCSSSIVRIRFSSLLPRLSTASLIDGPKSVPHIIAIQLMPGIQVGVEHL